MEPESVCVGGCILRRELEHLVIPDLTNSPEADNALILPPPPPLLHQCSILRGFKAALKSYTERKEVETLISTRIKLFFFILALLFGSCVGIHGTHRKHQEWRSKRSRPIFEGESH